MYEGPEFRHLRYFIAVAEECNMGRAAVREHVTQPTLSEQIKQLEEGLRTQLFLRNRAGCTLTATGRAFLPFAQNMLQMRSQAVEATSSTHSGIQLPLRFGYSAFIDHQLVEDALTGFCELVPDGKIEPYSDTSGRLVSMVLDGQLEAALVTKPVPSDGLFLKPVCEEQIYTLLPGGASLPIMLSPAARAQGFDTFYRAPARSYADRSLYRWMRVAIFGGDSLARAYAWPLGESFLVFVIALAFSTPRDIRRLKELKYGRRLKGRVMHEAKAFNKVVKGDGIGIQTGDSKTILRIPKANEAQHLEIIGDTGSGKTTLIMQMLQQINQRGESAIVYDPACEFVQRFYDESRGDVILNPLDARCPYWGPAKELRRKAEAKAISASLYQPTSDKKGEFFTETPQKIFAHLLTFGPTPQQLVEWMSNPAEIDRRVEGTELASILEPGAQQQRVGVLASLGLIADSLRMLPTKE